MSIIPAPTSGRDQTPAQRVELREGEVVDLTLRGVTVGWHHNLETGFRLPGTEIDGHARYLHLYLDELPADAVIVTRTIPVDGEPKPGDVWADAHGMALFAYTSDFVDDVVSLAPARPVPGWRNAEWWDWHRSQTRGPIRLVWRATQYDDLAVDEQRTHGHPHRPADPDATEGTGTP